MPLLYILAGPNGAGKTTFYDTSLRDTYIPKSLPYLNVDVAAKELGSYSSENFAKAEMIVRTQMSRLIEQKQDFMIESNLAKEADYEWLQKMIASGYELILYFLCTDNLEIHYNRVQRRVKEGGHDVPKEIIRHRYNMVLTRLRSQLFLFKESYLFDTTSDTAVLMAYLEYGKIVDKRSDEIGWVNHLLLIAERLSQR